MDKSSGDPKANSLAVNIGFILSQPTKYGAHHVSIPIKIPGYEFFSVTDAYGYSAQSLEARHILGLDTNVHTNKVQLNGPLHYHANVDGPTYENKFHHSEPAFYEYITQRSNVDSIVKRLKEHGVQQGTVIEAVTIDMHSIRYICGNCEIGALGLINTNYHFISNLSEALYYSGFAIPESFKIVPRISANKPDSNKASMLTTQHKNINHVMLGTTLFEADTRVYKLPSTDTDLHNRSIFISSDISKCNHYNYTFNNILQHEYAGMIYHGRTVTNHFNLNPKNTENRIFVIYDNLFHSPKDIEKIENAFYELSLIDKVDNKNYTQLDRELAAKIVKARQELDNEIATDNLKLTELKYKLLEEGSDNILITSLSADALININILFEKYGVKIEYLVETINNLDFLKILQKLPKSALELIADVLFLENTIEINEFIIMYRLYSNKFLDFIEESYNSELPVNEDWQFYIELYLNKVELDNISFILNYADLDQIKSLYNRSTHDFPDFISEIYEEEDLLEEREIIDLFELYIKVPHEDRWFLWEYLKGNSNPDKASTQRMDSYLNTHGDISTDSSSYGSDDEYNIYLAGEL